MPYIGNSPGTGTRNRFIYTATASQTTFSGADDNGKTLKYADSDYVDVYLNGICLVPVTDYTSTSKTSIVLTQAASLNDTLEVVAYDIATISDTVSKADGGTFDGNVTFGSGADIITETLGTDNVRIGENAGDSIASGGANNVAIGKDAGTAISTGDLNVAVGSNALKTISTHSNNTAVGAFALDAGTGNSNVAVGSGALGNASYAADNNIGIGKDALNGNTTGDSNVAVGHEALLTNSTAGNNTAVGYQAGRTTATGDSNTFVGQQAGYSTVGNRNTFLGRFAGNASNLAATQQNTFVGCFSGRYITSGAKNSILGAYDGNQDGVDIRTSSNSIVLSDGDGTVGFIYDGSETSPLWKMNNSTNGNWTCRMVHKSSSSPYGIHINYPLTAPNGNDNYALYFNDSSSARFFVRSNGDVDNTNNSYGAISDLKLKENIEAASSQWDDIKAVQVKKYSLKADDLDAPNMVGVIAQDLEASGMNGLVEETVDRDDNMNDLGTTTKSVKYSVLYMKAVKALQEAMTRIETLETENTAIKARLDALEAG